MSNRKALKGAIAAVVSIATLGALAAPALADETTTYNLNGKSVAELAQHGGAQRIAAIGNGNAKNVILFIGDGMGDSEITVARDYLKGANGHFEGLDAVGQPAELGDTNAGKAAARIHPASPPPSRWAATAATAQSARTPTAASTPTRTRASSPQ